MGWTYAFSKPCEPESLHESYSSVASLDKISHYNFFEDEKWMESCALEKWESTLSLRVHVHGPDVELIMEASCKTFNQLDNSSGVFELDPLQLWFRPYWYSLIPFLGQVKVLVFCRSIHLSTLYFALPPSVTLWYLDNIIEPCCLLWAFIEYYSSPIPMFPGSELLVTRGHR